MYIYKYIYVYILWHCYNKKVKFLTCIACICVWKHTENKHNNNNNKHNNIYINIYIRIYVMALLHTMGIQQCHNGYDIHIL